MPGIEDKYFFNSSDCSSMLHHWKQFQFNNLKASSITWDSSSKLTCYTDSSQTFDQSMNQTLLLKVWTATPSSGACWKGRISGCIQELLNQNLDFNTITMHLKFEKCCVLGSQSVGPHPDVLIQKTKILEPLLRTWIYEARLLSSFTSR